MATMTSHRRPTRALLPQVETTMLIEGITKPIIECKARKAFSLGYVTLNAGEAFFLVRSDRRENRYYIVKYNDGHCRYQCSCGCGFAEHQHLTMVREHVAAAEPVAETMAAEESVEVVAEAEEVAGEVDGRTMVDQEISRRLALLKTSRIDTLRYIASKRGIDIKSRKRVDFINAIIGSVKLELERKYCLV